MSVRALHALRSLKAAMPHIIVVGAGICGVTTAYALLQRGYQVTVLDRQRYPAMETSFANGGQLSASNAEVWNKAATVLTGLRWMLRRDAPLLLNPRPNWHKYSWLAEFVAGIPKHRQNTIRTVKLAIEARHRLFEIAERENIAFDLERRGILHVYYDKRAFDAGLKTNALLREGGLDRHAVGPEEMRAIEPALKGRYYGGLFTPSDASGDIHKFTRGLAEVCVSRGVRFIFNANVENVSVAPDTVRVSWSEGVTGRNRSKPKTLGLDCQAIVVCAGVGSGHFASRLGDRVKVYPVKGYSITVQMDRQDEPHAPKVSLLDDAAKIVASRLGDDRLRVAGTAELNGFNTDIRSDRVRPLVDWVRSNFPDVGTSKIVAWAGLRPMTPNMLPIVCPSRRPNVFYNTGHGHLGWTLSAATAEIVAHAIEQARTGY